MKNSTLWLLLLGAVLAFPAEMGAQTGEKKPAAPPSMTFVATDAAPKAIGPYSQAVVAGGFLFAAGQIPLDPKTGDLVGATIEQSTERIFDNLEAVLKAAGLTFSDVVKTTVFLTKADDFAPMNKVYAKRMGEGKPARSTVIVAALPKGSSIEIDLIAVVKK